MSLPFRPLPPAPQILLPLANTWTAKNTFTPPANTEAIVISGYSLTGANAQSALSIAGTWNTSGVAHALDVNITETAAGGGSTLARFRLGGQTKFAIRRDGYLFSDTTITYSHGSGGAYVIVENFSSIPEIYVDSGGLRIANGRSLSFGSSGVDSPDTHAHRDGVGIIARRHGTTAQADRLYANYVSTTDYHRCGYSTAKTTLSGVSGASVTATGLIPDGAVVIGVTTKVTTALGTGSGTTGYQVGDGVDPDRWGDVTGTAIGTSTDNTNATATTVQMFTAANDVVITANGGNFNGTGVIMVCVFYLRAECD